MTPRSDTPAGLANSHHPAKGKSSQDGGVASILADLTSDRDQVREAAVMRVGGLGADTPAVLVAVARAIGDRNECVAYQAFRIVEQLCSDLLTRHPDLWTRLGSEEARTRLAAVDELVKLLPASTPLPSPESGGRTAAIREDPVPQSANPSVLPTLLY